MNTLKLFRRGFFLGSIDPEYNESSEIDLQAVSMAWNSGHAYKLSGLTRTEVTNHELSIARSKRLYESILDEIDVDEILDSEPYKARLVSSFEALGASFSEGNLQEIETVFFDGVKNEKIIAEDLWVKISWLSFDEEDDSLRLRFSFGVDFEEDVSRDGLRQNYAAKLAEAVFPECEIIAENEALRTLLKTLLGCDSVQFVERIVYFNAPNGGAYLHHDRERGHAGVAYAQLTGSTFWIALPRAELVTQIRRFVLGCDRGSISWPNDISFKMRQELLLLTKEVSKLKVELESFSNNALIQLINESECFVQNLISLGYGSLIEPGDVLLLPQATEDLCCWHSVFCVGDKAGEALSFAIRAE